MAVRNNVRRIRRKFMSNPAYMTVLAIVLILCLFYLDHEPTTPPEKVDAPLFTTTVDDPAVNWAKFAYAQYVASSDDLCRAVMLFSELQEASSLALRVLLYPSNWSIISANEDIQDMHAGDIARLLRYAAEEFSVLLQPVDFLRQEDPSRTIWRDSYTKFLAFNLTRYERVMIIGSDSVVLNSPDELFLLSDASLAMPYLYWGKRIGWQLSSQLMVVKPSVSEFAKIERAVRSAAEEEVDIDIINLHYNGTLTELPARPYHTLTDEFRHRDKDHVKYLGSRKEIWDTTKILEEAKIVHFFDPPLPKPWMDAEAKWQYYVPFCLPTAYRKKDCRNSNAWWNFYNDYTNRRWNICGKDYGPQA